MIDPKSVEEVLGPMLAFLVVVGGPVALLLVLDSLYTDHRRRSRLKEFDRTIDRLEKKHGIKGKDGTTIRGFRQDA